MTELFALLRGMWWRRGLSGMILIVAVIAAAASTTGPAYYAAAKTSIVQDDLHAGLPIEKGLEVTDQGASPGDLDTQRQQALDALQHTPRPGLFDPPILGYEVGPVTVPGTTQATTLVYRDGACAHLRIVHGRCPQAPGEGIASTALAKLDHWKVGQTLTLGMKLRLVGTYEPRDPNAQYWFGRGYFPSGGLLPAGGLGGQEPVDAVFVIRQAFDAGISFGTGESVVDLPLGIGRVTSADVAPLHQTVDAFLKSMRLNHPDTVSVSGISTVLDEVSASWRALAVPVFLITAQLLVLTWLLLFLVITDAAEARGPEVALSKLRGFSRWRAVRFGLAEPVLLLLAALPLGALVGWAATVGLSSVLLRPGTPVSLPGTGWVAAAIAVAGGMVAAALAARRTLVRPVVEQWRRAGRNATRRTWLLDAILLTGTVAGLVELFSARGIGSASGDVLALLVPGLLGLAAAVVASRLLPALCRATYRRTRNAGGIAGFLAVRQIARRPNGVRTTIVLATAFGLAAFAIAAWSVSRTNLRDVAATQVGAAAVLTVAPPDGTSLPQLIDKLDPSGDRAMAVEQYVDFGNQSRQFFAVDPHRFARIASWRPDFAHQSLAQLTSQLAPPAPPPIGVTGDRMRISVDVQQLTASQPFRLEADLKVPGALGATPVDFGPQLHQGHNILEAELPPCPCQLRRLYLIAANGGNPQATGHLVFTRITQHGSGGWSPVSALLDRKGAWEPDFDAGSGSAKPSGQGLSLTFQVPDSVTPGMATYAWPHPLPALTTASVAKDGAGHPAQTAGLDGDQLTVKPLAVVPVPGAPDNGVIVDRTYAERASSGDALSVAHQVWLSAPAMHTFPAKLRAAGVRIVDTQTAAGLAAQYSRQGPALALVLFLADAAAAALLAAGGAVLALYLSGRRRTYELAALAVAGARPATLRRGLLLEQALTLGFGTLVGIGAGVLAAVLALPSVPEFVHTPSAPALRYGLDPVPLAVLLAVAVVLLAAAAILSSLALVRAARPDQLREAPA